MTYPVNFGGLAAGNQPLSDFDTMFAVAGQQGNIPCTAAGTNAITLTPGTNYYVPSSYTNAQLASFKAVNNSTGSVTLQIGGLGLLKLFTAAGVQAGSGDIVNNTHYEIQYWADLDSSAGGFIILNATVTAIANPTVASFSKLKVTNNAGTPLTKADITADAIVMQNGSGGTVRSTSVSVTINFAVNGANGLDTGSLANGSLTYFMYVIFNANTSTVAGLASLSATAPTMPSGYTYSARVGAMKSDSATANLMGTLQFGKTTQYQMGLAKTTRPFLINNGSTGSYSITSPTLTAQAITAAIPSTASRYGLMVTNIFGGGAGSNVLVAPSTAWGGTNNGPEGSNGVVWPCWMIGTVASAVEIWFSNEGSFGWASDQAGGGIACIGWEDNL